MGKKIKVLEVCGGHFLTGGSSVIAWNWYKNFDFSKIQADFLCTDKPDDEFINIMKTHGSNCYYQKSRGNKLMQRIRLIALTRRIAKANQYNCIHIHGAKADKILSIYLVSKKYTKAFIIHSHNSKLEASGISQLLHKICKNLLVGKRITYFACSDVAAEWLFPKKIVKAKKYTCIKNGIDVSKFAFNMDTRQRVRESLGVGNSFLVGHVGRFVRQKNHLFLINVFAKVKEIAPDAKLLLIGGGDSFLDLSEEIKAQVKELHIEDSVIFYGKSDRVNELYQAMDCFVFPSRFEGLGIVAIEAQTAGLRTLCSDGVPQEAKITNLLEYMPLSDGAEKWAEKILTYNDGYGRKDMSNIIRDAGFDLLNSAAFIQRKYEELSN